MTKSNHVDTVFSRLGERVTHWLSMGQIRPLDFALFAAFGFVLYWLMWGAGAVLLTTFPVDFVFSLQEAWKVNEGLVPYVDFLSPVGPMFYWLNALNSSLRGLEAYHVASMTFWPAYFASLAMMWVASRRLSAGLTWVLTLFFFIIAISPRNVDLVYSGIGFFGEYNSLAWATIAPVVVAILFPVRNTESMRVVLAEALLLGFLLFFTTTLKLTMAAPVVLPFLYAFFAFRSERLRLFAMSCVWAILTGLVILLLWETIPGHVEAIRHSLASGEDRLKLQFFAYMQVELPTFVSVIALLFIIEQYRKGAVPGAGGAFAQMALCALMAFMMMANNHETVALAVVFVFLVFLVFMIRNAPPSPIRLVIAALPLAIFVGHHAFQDIVGIGVYSGRAYAKLIMSEEKPNMMTERGIFILGEEKDDEFTLPAISVSFSEAAQYLKDNGLDKKKILSTEFATVYGWLLEAPSPRGTILSWYDHRRTFSENSYPPAESTLADVEVIVDHNYEVATENRDKFWELYGEYIKGNFEQVENGRFWSVWVRLSSES